jgi:hypothetical protein
LSKKKEAAQQSISSQMAVARAPAHAAAAVERERHDHTRRGKSDNHAITHYPRRRPPRPPGTETPHGRHRPPPPANPLFDSHRIQSRPWLVPHSWPPKVVQNTSLSLRLSTSKESGKTRTDLERSSSRSARVKHAKLS